MAASALLHLQGVPPDARTPSGCDSFLRNCQNESGGFSLTKTLRSGIFPCTTGAHLPFLVYFGFGDDPRSRQAAFDFLIEDMSAGGRCRLAGATTTAPAYGLCHCGAMKYSGAQWLSGAQWPGGAARRAAFGALPYQPPWCSAWRMTCWMPLTISTASTSAG